MPIVAYASADGKKLHQIIIVKGKTHQSLHRYNVSEGIPDAVYTFKKKAWILDELGVEWLECIFLLNCGSSWPHLLLMDGHRFHEVLGLLEKAVENDIHFMKIPPRTTSKLQPFDIACYGPLKRKNSSIVSGWMAKSPSNHMNRWNWPKMFRMAYAKAMVPRNIISGFACTRVYLSNPLAIKPSAFLVSEPFMEHGQHYPDDKYLLQWIIDEIGNPIQQEARTRRATAADALTTTASHHSLAVNEMQYAIGITARGVTHRDMCNTVKTISTQYAIISNPEQQVTIGDTEQQGTVPGNRSQSTILGNRSHLVMLGNRSQSAMVGKKSQSAVLGNRAQSAMPGSRSVSAMLGNRSQSAMLGNRSQSAVLGNRSQSAMPCKRTQSAILFNRSQSAILGNRSQSAILGNRSQSVILGNRSQSTILGSLNKLVILGRMQQSMIRTFIDGCAGLHHRLTVLVKWGVCHSTCWQRLWSQHLPYGTRSWTKCFRCPYQWNELSPPETKDNVPK